MHAATTRNPLNELTARLDAAVSLADARVRCDAVVAAVQGFVGSGFALDEAWLRAPAEGYGRRLLHRHASGLYTIVVMAWGPGQGTPVHDHAGLWCVECVYRGRIRVVSFRQVEVAGDRARFAPEREVRAGVGEAGALIPPFDYHTIDNPYREPAATLHVYGGDMTSCRVFEASPDGWHHGRVRDLRYTAD